VSVLVSIEGRLIVDSAGNTTAVWIANRIDQPTFSPLAWAARSPPGTVTWTEARPISDPAEQAGGPPQLRVDEVGRVTASWSNRWAAQYRPSIDEWTPPARIPGVPVVDRAGNIFIYSADATAIEVARYSVTTEVLGIPEPVLMSNGRSSLSVGLLVDNSGGATLVWSPCRLEGQPVRCTHGALESTRWLATPAAPVPTLAHAGGGEVAVAFTPPPTGDPAFAATSYEYTTDEGSTWTPRVPASTVSPLRIAGLREGITHRIRLRARNRAGPGVMSEAIVVLPEPAPEAPTDFVVLAQSGSRITFGWTPADHGLAPTGFALEAGRVPSEVVATLPTGGTAPIFTVTAPAGTYYVRVHALAGSAWSLASNEIRVVVQQPEAPSAPVGLLGLVNGPELALSWTNTFTGGEPTNLWLLVSGATTTSLPLPMGDGFRFALVPPGVYTLSVVASNAYGVSPPSNTVTLTFPDLCSGVPQAPLAFQAWLVGTTIVVSWSPPVSGPAVTGYTVQVTGAYAGHFTTTARTQSGVAAPGRYTLNVKATNPCGTGPPTPEQTVVVPWSRTRDATGPA